MLAEIATIGRSVKKKSQSKEQTKEVNFFEEYSFCIGTLGIPKDAYFALTPSETRAICEGYVYNNDRLQSYIRPIFAALYNQFAKQPKTAVQLWPLSIDGEKAEPISEDEMYERNKQIIENYKRLTGDNSIN